MAISLFIVQLAVTLFMTGVIWVIQIVHYPLFASVGRELFSAYARAHSQLITYVVMPPMLVELGLASAMLFLRPTQVAAWIAWVGFGLTVLIWLSTFFLQVPQHSILVDGFNDAAHQLLVSSNWVRTVAWSTRSILLLWVLSKIVN